MSIDDFYRKQFGKIAGVDEAGRGPLAGPVVASAVIIKEHIAGIKDSKLLSPERREKLFQEILDNAVVGIGIATPEEIDIYNIFHATRIAMNRALENLAEKPDYVIVDGKWLRLSHPGTCVVMGDKKSESIGAASIVAKVVRDRIMRAYSRVFPEYGFDKNKGYPTKDHIEKLKEHGVTWFHRLTFSPVRKYLTLKELEKMLREGRISERRYEKIKGVIG